MCARDPRLRPHPPVPGPLAALSRPLLAFGPCSRSCPHVDGHKRTDGPPLTSATSTRQAELPVQPADADRVGAVGDAPQDVERRSV